ncbi:MAG: glucose 1-dehydrogenase [Candidatus Korobacteraceae bacterium]
MARMKGKVAVVTGASKGIGAAIAQRFGEEGASVVVHYGSDKKGAEKVVAAIEKAGSKAVAVQGDLSKPDEVGKVFEAAGAAFGKIDVLVNNAGVYDFRPLPQIDAEHFHKHFDLNVLGLLLATREAVKRMNGGGSVINISSLVSLSPMANSAVYSATKAAVDAITQSLAQELGPQNIRVNSLLPGVTVTEGFNAMGGVAKGFEALAVSRTPLGRVGTAADIAGAALFLATEDSGWVTGAEIPVGGGLRP